MVLIALEEEEVCVPSLGRCDWCTIVCVALTIDPYINSSLSCAHSNKITKGTVMTIIILSLLSMVSQP